MSGDDGFLSRWARRKEEVRKEQVQELTQEQALVPAADAAATPAAEPEFDLASLPSLDSLTASSDIKMFLQKGVPQELRNAALRTAWVSDPAIRDYIGLADFQWDFNAPGAITGYGELAPGTDIAAMMADITESHLKKVVDVVSDMTDVLPEPVTVPEAIAAPDERAEETESADTLASQDNPDAPQIPLPPQRRRHGSATPR